MKLVKVLFLLCATVLLSISMLYAKAEYTKKEGKPCAYCHIKAGSKDLNDVGKCYEKAHKLDNCKPSESKK